MFISLPGRVAHNRTIFFFFLAVRQLIYSLIDMMTDSKPIHHIESGGPVSLKVGSTFRDGSCINI